MGQLREDGESQPAVAGLEAADQGLLRAEGPAARWVEALLSGSEVLDGSGHALRHITEPSGRHNQSR